MRRVVRRRIRRSTPGLNLVSDVNVVVVSGSGAATAAQRVRVDQGRGQTVDDVTVEGHGDGDTAR